MTTRDIKDREPAPPREGAPAGCADPAQAGLDPGEGPDLGGLQAHPRHPARNRLVTVCEEAGCPNVGECWSQGHATMMIMGEICTRGCTFCNVATGRPDALDVFEPARVAVAVEKLGLNHVVITSVDRDDLADGGAEHIAQTIRAVRRKNPATTIEVLVPDFLNCPASALEAVVAARPDVFNHNLETVPGLYPEVRPGARYFHWLRMLQRVKELDPAMFTKSGIMVGLGEERQAVLQVMDDMRAADVDFLTDRAVPAADAEAPRGGAVRHAGGVRRLREGGVRQGLPDGLGDASDAVQLPRRRRFRAAAGGAARPAGRA